MPSEFRAGDTWKWTTAALADYPASGGWSLSTAFRGPSLLDVAGVADGDGWGSTAAATATAAILPGTYAWQSRVALSGEIFTVASGVLTVLPSIIDQQAGFESRTTAQIQLAACEAALLKLVGKTNVSVSFGDQSYTLQDIEKLERVRNRLRDQVAAETRRANGGGANQILVHFTRP